MKIPEKETSTMLIKNVKMTQIQNVFSLEFFLRKNKQKGLRQVGLFNRLFTLKSGFFQRYFLIQLARKNSKTIGGISYETECNPETVAFICVQKHQN